MLMRLRIWYISSLKEFGVYLELALLPYGPFDIRVWVDILEVTGGRGWRAWFIADRGREVRKR